MKLHRSLSPLGQLCCQLLLGSLILPATFIAAAEEPLRSASEPYYPPLSLIGEQGQADGFAVELLHAAVRAMGQQIDFKVQPWAEIKQSLAEDRLDVLPLVGRTPEREEIFDFTVPYLRLHGTIVVRKETNDIRKVEDLRGRRIGVMAGDNAEEFMHREQLTEELVSTRTYKEALQRLAAGELDAVVVQRLVALQLIESLGLRRLETLGKLSGFRQDFCFAVTEGDKELLAQLNEGLAVVIADGTYDRLREKWLGVLEQDQTAKYFYVTLTSVIITLLIALLVAYLWQRSLRRQVESRTAELQQKNIAHQRSEEELLRSEQALIKAHDELEKRVLERTQDLLREKQFSDTTITSLPGIFYLFDEQGKFLRWNRNFETVSGYSEAEIAQMHPVEFFHAEEHLIIELMLLIDSIPTVSCTP